MELEHARRWGIALPGRWSAAWLAAGLLLGMRPGTDPRFTVRTVHPGKEAITLHWKDASGHVLGNIGALEQELARQGRTLRFAMNGGMYTQEQAPVGLYVEDGHTLHRLDTSRAAGDNFHMQPNGVFGIHDDSTAFLCTTAAYPLQQHVRFATQSGPMLLVDGVINGQFREGSKNLNIRNGVGIKPGGELVFVISREPVNFHAVASFFRQQGCTDALYLDGAISKACIPEAGLRQLDGQLGVLIAISAPARR